MPECVTGSLSNVKKNILFLFIKLFPYPAKREGVSALSFCCLRKMDHFCTTCRIEKGDHMHKRKGIFPLIMVPAQTISAVITGIMPVGLHPVKKKGGDGEAWSPVNNERLAL